uniref:Uncharacterized protein n=1 Tax=Chromera velia CCMP2878 TaxID=1169474 RepID=A0A0G4FVD9_9ALVE|eukprot:Cvel_485.t1-p1 / transcript=Cvel_485.t1 / gene=Cvel_485 / organism=Chromera_velia_CCMP2878 / gene_product=Putative ankyrin repeat protein RF_0381, putative / transcript_product=Putative ankyrin repeat protein RF_0381, putative / location=Cvel_scaffold15:95125-96582(-) / protein_length=486 / sequence_SO=supercontig / SO=protein_coding / is_pseudo=false
MMRDSDSIFSVLRDIETFEDTIIRLVESVREKRKVLTKVACSNLGISVAPSPESSPPPAVYQAGKLPTDIAASFTALQVEMQTSVQTLRERIHSLLDQMVSRYYKMDLSPLFAIPVGSVIRAFMPIDAEALGDAVEAFAKGEMQRDDLLLLLKVGADTEGMVRGRTALARAVYAASLPAVEVLVEAGADLEKEGAEIDFEGCRALHYASNERHIEIVRFLVSKGASVKARDQYGHTALDCAVFKGSLEIVQILLSEGADPHTKDEDGTSTLHEAAAGGHVQIAGLLLDLGIDVDVRTNQQTTPLHHTAFHCSDESEAPVWDRGEMAEFLISRGADVNARFEHEQTLLHRAASLGCVEVLKVALDRGAHTHATDARGLTALHAAAIHFPMREFDNLQESKLQIAEILVARGVDPNAVDDAGRTALDFASHCLHEEAPFCVFLAGFLDEIPEAEEEDEEDSEEEDEGLEEGEDEQNSDEEEHNNEEEG